LTELVFAMDIKQVRTVVSGKFRVTSNQFEAKKERHE